MSDTKIPTMPEQLTDQIALTILVNATRIAQAKGVYSLEEAGLISRAIMHFSPPPPQPAPQPTEGAISTPQ